MSRERFFRAEKWLADELRAGRLDVGAFALLHFVGESGADLEDGFETSLAELARVLGCSEKTISRRVHALRDAGLLLTDLCQGRRTFRCWIGVRFSRSPVTAPSRELRTQLRTPEKEVVSEVTSDTQQVVTRRNPREQTRSRPVEPRTDSSISAGETKRHHRDTERLEPSLRSGSRRSGGDLGVAAHEPELTEREAVEPLAVSDSGSRSALELALAAVPAAVARFPHDPRLVMRELARRHGLAAADVARLGEAVAVATRERMVAA